MKDMYAKGNLFQIVSNRNQHGFKTGEIVMIRGYAGISAFWPDNTRYYNCTYANGDINWGGGGVRVDDMVPYPRQNKGQAPAAIASQMNKKY